MTDYDKIYFLMIFAAGLWLVVMALLMKTQNIKSSMFFKVIPFLLGMGSLISLGKASGFF